VEQHELRPPRGATKARKRIGRGTGSGTGTYAGKGMKGQQSRSGYKTRPAFEGGQTALVRRLPRRRGFRNPFRVEYTPVNLSDLARLPAGSDVTPETLAAAGIVKTRLPIKVLAGGDVSAKLTVRAHRVSAAARAKIEAAGGTVEELSPRPEPVEKKKSRSALKAEAKAEAKSAKPAKASAEKDEQEQDDIDSEASESSEGAGAE
jgi:large subunit ribosomal protein L15